MVDSMHIHVSVLLILFTLHHLFCREVFLDHRWWGDPLYQAPMVETSYAQVFVGDFVNTVDRVSN